MSFGGVSFQTVLGGQFVGAQNNGGGAVIATATVAQAGEKFTLTDINGGSLESGDVVFIQAGNGQLFQAVNGGGSTLNAGSNNQRDWETFKIVKQTGGGVVNNGDVIGLQTSSGSWVSAQNGGGGPVFAYGAALGAWEQLKVSGLTVGAPPSPPAPPAPSSSSTTMTPVTFKTQLNGNFVGAQNNGGGAVIATTTVAQAWETFSLIDINGGTLDSGDSVFIQAGNGQFFQALNGGGTTLNAGSNNKLGWETFKIVKQAGSGTINSGEVIGLQASSGAWVSAANGGGGTVYAYGGALGAWESLMIAVPPSSGSNGGSGGSAGGSGGGAGGSGGSAGADGSNAGTGGTPPLPGNGAPGGNADACIARGQPGIAALPNLATQYQGTFNSPPTQTMTRETTDAPLLGNGDVGVAIIGTIDSMTFILGKTEFWSNGPEMLKAMARLSMTIPGMAGASYSMAQNVGTGQVTGKFTQGGANTINTTSWVQATDTTNNAVYTQLSYTGTAPQTVSVSIDNGLHYDYPTSLGSANDVLYRDVQADGADTVWGVKTNKVRLATRAIGTTGTVANGKLSFTLQPGQTVTLATGIMSNFDDAGYQSKVISNVSGLKPGDVAALSASHVAWWDNFHRTSFVQIPDKTIERHYYASLYLLASASRSGEMAPGIYGPWIFQDPAWNGGYTIDYNYEAPFFAAFPTNHPELANNYDAPVIGWVGNGQKLARDGGFTGALYPVVIYPYATNHNIPTLNMKSNNAWVATAMIMHYYYLPDLAYARSIYPTLQQMALFWENYLVKNGNNYDIINDAQQEFDEYPQTNGVMSLGLVRFLLQACIDISTALNVDAGERALWQDRLAHLSPFPTFTMNGKTVFRWTSVGRDWAGGNAIGIQHIYPGSQIGLSSDPVLLQTAFNMVDVMQRWDDANGTVTFYPAAARVGYTPTTILSHLKSWIQNNAYPNLHIHTAGGGVENFNTTPSTIAEMLLQSFQGTIRVFADWPRGADAKFGNLAAYSGFLVSSKMSQSAVKYVSVMSKMGGAFKLANPWGQGQVSVYVNGTSAPALSGSTLAMQTSPCDTVVLAPAGTSYASVVALMNAPQ